MGLFLSSFLGFFVFCSELDHGALSSNIFFLQQTVVYKLYFGLPVCRFLPGLSPKAGAAISSARKRTWSWLTCKWTHMAAHSWQMSNYLWKDFARVYANGTGTNAVAICMWNLYYNLNNFYKKGERHSCSFLHASKRSYLLQKAQHNGPWWQWL